MPTTDKHLTRGQKGHLAKAGVGNLKVLKEFKLDNYESLNVGDELKADTFAIGDRIDVTGISKGKGFAGVIKRQDVYKRQGGDCLVGELVTEGDHPVEIVAGTADGDNTERQAVSYTHLDVYKRQDQQSQSGQGSGANGEALAGRCGGVAQGVQSVGTVTDFFRQAAHFSDAAGVVGHGAVSVGCQGDVYKRQSTTCSPATSEKFSPSS